MAWVRLHDGALSHPKVIGIFDPRRPFDLWMWGLSYSQAHLTDGHLPMEAVPKGVGKAVQVLVDRKLWQAAEDGGYRIHDFLDWNDSKEVVAKKRSEAKERMRNVRGRSSRERPANVRQSTSHEVLRGSGNSSSSGSEKEEIGVNTDPDALERVMDAWRAHWKRAYGFEPSLLLSAIDQMKVEQQLAAIGEGKFLQAAAAYFATDDPFVLKAKHPLALFLRDPVKHLAGAPKAGPQRPRGCKHEPACTDDAAHTKRDLAERRAS